MSQGNMVGEVLDQTSRALQHLAGNKGFRVTGIASAASTPSVLLYISEKEEPKEFRESIGGESYPQPRSQDPLHIYVQGKIWTLSPLGSSPYYN